jgi:hypothetical protein
MVRASVWLGGLLLTTAACEPDLHVSVTRLEVSPNPAHAGEPVSFSFDLTVIPEQGFTLIVRIDGIEHTRITRFAAEDGPFTIDAGDAADLIASYGLGNHDAVIEVRLDDGASTATAARTFTLEEPPPPP